MVLLIRFYIKIRKIKSLNLETCLLKSDFESEAQKISYEILSTSSTSKRVHLHLTLLHTNFP